MFSCSTFFSCFLLFKYHCTVFVIFEDVWVIWSSSSISINQGVLGNINTLFSVLSFNFFTFLSKIPGDDHFYYTLSPNVVKFIRYLEHSKVRRNVNLEFLCSRWEIIEIVAITAWLEWVLEEMERKDSLIGGRASAAFCIQRSNWSMRCYRRRRLF